MQKINFQNLPSTATPINATNLNAIQDNAETAINSLDSSITGIEGELDICTGYTSCTYANSKYTCDIVDSLPANDIVQVFVPFSSQTSLTDSDVSISVDGGTTYYNIKDNSKTKNLKASTFRFKDTYLKLIFDGTSFLVLSPDIESNSSVVFKRITSNQSTSSGTFTTILYNDAEKSGLDFASINNGTITINVTGKYLLALNTIFDTNNTGGRYQDMFIGSVGWAISSTNGATGVRTGLNSIFQYNFTAGDTFTCRAYQTSGGSLNIMLASSLTIIKL